MQPDVHALLVTQLRAAQQNQLQYLNAGPALLDAVKTLVYLIANSHEGYLPVDDFQLSCAVHIAVEAIHQVEPGFVLTYDSFEDSYDESC